MYKDTASDAPASRRDLLPDIEEINSTLRRDKKSAGKEQPETQAQKNASGRRGFRAAIILLLLAVAVYAYADLITSNVPQLAPIWMPMLRKLINGERHCQIKRLVF